jgi:hypothetical protein
MWSAYIHCWATDVSSSMAVLLKFNLCFPTYFSLLGKTSSVTENYSPEITKFRVAIATKCRELTHWMNVRYVVGYDRVSILFLIRNGCLWHQHIPNRNPIVIFSLPLISTGCMWVNSVRVCLPLTSKVFSNKVTRSYGSGFSQLLTLAGWRSFQRY